MSFTEEEVKAACEKTRPGEWDNYLPESRQILVTFANELLAKREGKPIAHENVREGDHVRGIRPGHVTGSHSNPARRQATIIGEVYKSLDGRLVVGGAYLENLTDLSLIRRAVPQLPTEAPAVIKATEVRKVKGEWWMTLDAFGEWNTHEAINGYWGHRPVHITAWKHADFVVREDQP